MIVFALCFFLFCSSSDAIPPLHYLIYIYFSLLMCLSFYMPICHFVFVLSACVCVPSCLYFCMSNCLPICLHVCLSTSLCFYLSMFQYPSQQLTFLLFPSLFLSLAISPGVRCFGESPPVRYCTGNKSNKTEIDTKNMFIGTNLSAKVFPRISFLRIYPILSSSS